MRENLETKCVRLLIGGRLNVQSVNADEIRATVRGDSGELYRVGWDSFGWSCSCAAVSRCSHILALQRVALVPSPIRWEEASR